MPKTKTSPARSQGGITTPKRKPTRGSRSLCSPALSTASGRLTALIDQFKDKNMDSFALSPLNGRSVLNDNTEIEEPRRKSWWKKLDENSQDVMEVLEDNRLTVNNAIEEFIDIEILSQEKKNFTLDLPESSDNESINSIVLPQRKLFTQKENQPQKKYGHLIDNRESLAKLHKTNTANIDKTINVGTRELFQNAKRSKPIFPASLLNISSNKTAADKTRENALAEPKAQVRNIFGNRPTNKRKNMFADFIVSESEDEIPEIQPKVFGFQKKPEQRRISSISKGRDTSPALSITTDIEMDFRMLLPSSTMVENQLEDNIMLEDNTPIKRARLSKLSEAKESEAGTLQTNTTADKTKQSNKSVASKNKSKASPELKNKSLNSSRTTRSMLKNASKRDEQPNTASDKTKQSNKSVDSKNKSTASPEPNDKSLNSSSVARNILTNVSKRDEKINATTDKTKHSNKSVSKNKSIASPELENKSLNSLRRTSKANEEAINEIQEEVANESQEVENEVSQSENEEEANESDENEDEAIVSDVNEDEASESQEVEAEVIEGQEIEEETNESQEVEAKVNKSQKVEQETNDTQEIEEEANESQEVLIAQASDETNDEGMNEDKEETNESHVLENDSRGEEKSKEKSREAVNKSQKVEEETNKSKEIEGEADKSQEIEAEANNSQEDEEEANERLVMEAEENDNREDEEEANESHEIEEEANENESEEVENDKEESHEVVNEIQKVVEKTNESKKIEEEAHESQEIEAEANDSQEDEEEANERLVMEPEENDNREDEEEANESHEIEEEANDSQVIEAEVNESQVDEEEANESQEEADESQEIDDEAHENQEAVDAHASEEENDEGMDEDQEETDNESQVHENESQEVENDEEGSHEVVSEAESEEVDENQQTNDSDEADKAIASDPEISDDNQADEMEVDDDESEQESDNQSNQNEHESHDERQIEEQNEIEPSEEIEESPNLTHDTTGRHRKKDVNKSPEVILHDKTNLNDSFTAKGRNTSVRKTKSLIKNLNIKPSLAPSRDSAGFSDGTRNSSAEGSAWDSHRTTRKTLRQTFGKDFTPRKSLRALVLEKSAKRQTEHLELHSETVKFPLANSTEMPEDSNHHVEDIVESDHEVSRQTRQTTLEMYLQKMKEQNIEKRLKMEAAVRNSLKNPITNSLSLFKVPNKPAPRRPKPTQSKAKKPLKSIISIEDLPSEVIADMKYKPPKRFQPSNASWITKRLYKYLENKLEAKYDYKARVRAEQLVETIYSFAKDLRRHDVAPPDAVDVLKHELARLEVVRTHFEFYEFFHDFMPREVRIKVVPDIVNKIPLPRHGPFSDILRNGNTVHE